MKLCEKIYFCRKKCGLSQEALADALGVSRQAVSKWETGEASPEISKLAPLASVFGVTADWLLSEEEPDNAEDLPGSRAAASRSEDGFAGDKSNGGFGTDASEGAKAARETSSELSGIPAFLTGLAKKYGWLVGVYIACIGAVFVLFGIFSLVLSNHMVSSFEKTAGAMASAFDDMGGTMLFPGQQQGMVIYDSEGNVITDPAITSIFGAAEPTRQSRGSDPVGIFSVFFFLIGFALIAAGTVLAVRLRKKE